MVPPPPWRYHANPIVVVDRCRRFPWIVQGHSSRTHAQGMARKCFGRFRAHGLTDQHRCLQLPSRA